MKQRIHVRLRQSDFAALRIDFTPSAQPAVKADSTCATVVARPVCDHSKAVVRTGRVTARPIVSVFVSSNHCKIKAIRLALPVLVANKLKSIPLPKSVARPPITGESSSLKQTTHAQTTGRAIARPNLHKSKPA